MRDPYLYQTIHLRGRRPLQVDRHAELLGEWAAELFGIGYAPDARDLERRIAALAERERYPRDLSSFVRLELGADGAERLLAAGISLYEGPALRSVTPDAVVVEFSSPLAEAPTSAREAAAALARVQAALRGAPVAVQCSDGVLLTADDAPLFAVRDKRVLTAPAPPSVERQRVFDACAALGLEVDDEPLAPDRLARYDELFYADHRGITALGHCEGVPYMSLTAARIAAAMGRL